MAHKVVWFENGSDRYYDFVDRRFHMATGEIIQGEGIRDYEHQLLELLVDRAGEVLSRDMILSHIKGDSDCSPEPKSVDNHITNLRKYLDSQLSVKVIGTVWGVGYRYTGTNAVFLEQEKDDQKKNLHTSSKHNQNNIFKFSLGLIKKLSIKKIITFTLVFIIVLVGILYSLYFFNTKAEYKSFMVQAEECRSIDDYVLAAINYQRASEVSKKLPFNLNDYVEALCKQGNCYLLAAMNSGNEGEKELYAKAAGIYGDIIHDTTLEDCIYYIDALCGLSTVYENTGHFIDEEWANLIQEILESAEKLNSSDLASSEISDIDIEQLRRQIKIKSAYAGYLYVAIRQEQAFGYYPDVIQSAISNWEELSKLLTIAAGKDFELSLIFAPTYYNLRQVELLVFLASSVAVDSPEYAEEAIAICQSELEKPGLRNSDIAVYIAFNTLMGESYRHLGEYYKQDRAKAEGYMIKAYDTVIPLLRLRYNVAPIQLLNAAYEVLFSDQCTQQDINEILQFYQEFYNQLDIAGDPQNATVMVLNICDACRKIIESYGFSQVAWDMGRDAVEQIETIKDYLQYSHRTGFQELKEYFYPN